MEEPLQRTPSVDEMVDHLNLTDLQSGELDAVKSALESLGTANLQRALANAGVAEDRISALADQVKQGIRGSGTAPAFWEVVATIAVFLSGPALPAVFYRNQPSAAAVGLVMIIVWGVYKRAAASSVLYWCWYGICTVVMIMRRLASWIPTLLFWGTGFFRTTTSFAICSSFSATQQ